MNGVKFIRKNGRVIPIKEDKYNPRKLSNKSGQSPSKNGDALMTRDKYDRLKEFTNAAKNIREGQKKGHIFGAVSGASAIGGAVATAISKGSSGKIKGIKRLSYLAGMMKTKRGIGGAVAIAASAAAGAILGSGIGGSIGRSRAIKKETKKLRSTGLK